VEKYAGVVEKYLVDRGTPLLNGDKASFLP
jgi:hypothetical protein